MRRLFQFSTFLLVFLFPHTWAWSLTGQSEQSLDSVANIEFIPDVRIFAVMSALNLAGFDYEGTGTEMSAVRRQVREQLEDTDPKLVERLRAFYSQHRTHADEADEQVAYTSLALLLSGPPEFELLLEEAEVPEDVWQIREFGSLVEEFYESAQVESLWATFSSSYEAELSSYQTVVEDVIAQTLEYFRIPPRTALDRKIILIPDLLNAKQIVNARNLDHVYYIVVGPTDDASENHQQVQHEYLHFLVDPLIEKFGLLLLKHGDLLELAQVQPKVRDQYRNKFFLIIAESLIETVVLRLHPPQDPSGMLIDLFRRGLIAAPYFLRGLERYERETELISFPSYVETLFTDIDQGTINEDTKVIAAWEAERKTAEQKEAEELQVKMDEAERQNRITTLLNYAAIQLSRKEFDQAGETVNRILLEDPENSNAFFYRAQIASQRSRYDEAFEDYRKASSAAGAPKWIQAWAQVRIGNYLASQRKFPEARRYFEQVVEMEGDLRGAEAEAHKSLGRLPQDTVP